MFLILILIENINLVKITIHNLLQKLLSDSD
jgi:hypothetical protein